MNKTTTIEVPGLAGAIAEIEKRNGVVKHTPGPWEVIKHGRAPLDAITIRRDYTSGEYVAQIFPMGSDSPLVVASNAALIAAAPQLYDAITLLVGYQNGCPLPSYEKGWTEAMELARAAIAKVEGRAQ